MTAERLAGIWGVAATEVAVDGGLAQGWACEEVEGSWGVRGMLGKLAETLIVGDGAVDAVGAEAELVSVCGAEGKGVEGSV